MVHSRRILELPHDNRPGDYIPPNDLVYKTRVTILSYLDFCGESTTETLLTEISANLVSKDVAFEDRPTGMQVSMAFARLLVDMEREGLIESLKRLQIYFTVTPHGKSRIVLLHEPGVDEALAKEFVEKLASDVPEVREQAIAALLDAMNQHEA